MSATTPWGNRSLRTKLYGPRTIAVPGGVAGSPGFVEIALPSWGSAITIAGNQTLVRFGFDKRIHFSPDTAWTINDDGLFQTDSTALFIDGALWSRNDFFFRDITIFNNGPASQNIVFAVLLTDVPYDAMPHLSADTGAWGTYNSNSNNPA